MKVNLGNVSWPGTSSRIASFRNEGGGGGICPLEADRDEVGLVELCELERASAVDGCTRSLGGMKTPGPLIIAQIPSVVVPVCVLTSVAKCVLKRAQSVSKMACVGEMACFSERSCMEEARCVGETVCVKETVCERNTERE